MAKRMLIDATHPEETRVVVLNGNRLEEFDFETSTKRQVKGNIYLAKVTRVEPSLQAAFVEYGGNRHGFLAFSEIHSDYYRIPVGDRGRVAGDFQPAELVRLEESGEFADDGGVPLDEALPDSVAVVETDHKSDDPADNGDGRADAGTSTEPGFRTQASEISGLIGHAEDETEAQAEASGQQDGPSDVLGASEAPATEPAPAPLREPGPPPGDIQEVHEPTAETAASRSEPGSTPAPAWFAASAGDDIIVAPETPLAGADGERSIAAAADPDLGARGQDHQAGTTFDTADRVPEQSETSEPRDLADHAMGEYQGFEAVLSADPQNTALRDFARAAAGETDFHHSDLLETGGSADDEVGERHLDETHGPEAREPADGSPDSEVIETLGGDEFEEVETPRSPAHRHYKIQEVIKRRQIMLVQVTKEERGNKGAALTTYLSLAGRYCVLMPNTARGGGVSRKITNLADRRRLKEILEELDIPEGMGVIVRTAGAERSKAEIKRDYEYLLRLWNEIRELTLRSTAPALIYEEGDLIKRSIRDLYTRDIDEVLVEGEEGYRTAKAFMKMLMPSHAKRVQPYRDAQIGLLHRFQVESQIDAIHSPVVQLRSGGYVVIDQTEALVAIDVNSGRATRERNIEETALRTNLEAAEEIARQLRLRDLAGLIVIDFIDMEEHRNQGAVERRLKEALRSDRARIQVGRISPFGLLEMSRQRLRSSLTEASTQPCPHCGGAGFIRSTESTALYVLRSIEEEGMRRRSAEICVYVPTTVALYILNNKRDSLAQLEIRYGIHVLVARDDSLIPPAFRLERLRALEPGGPVIGVSPPLTQFIDAGETEEEDLDNTGEAEDTDQSIVAGDEERVRVRRRRRRRRRQDDEHGRASSAESREEPTAAGTAATLSQADGDQEGEEDGEGGRLRRRRGRRGGRRRGRREEGAAADGEIGPAAADMVEIVPADAAPPGNDAGEAEEIAAAVSASPDQWLHSALSDRPGASTPTAIETASLPALAGEHAPAELSPATAEAPPQSTDAAAEAGGGASHAAPAAEMFGNAESPNIAAVSGADLAQAAEPEVLDRQDAAPASTEPMAKPVSEPPPTPETQAQANRENTSTQLVEEVKKTPENPRRGWWQRLIQP